MEMTRNAAALTGRPRPVRVGPVKSDPPPTKSAPPKKRNSPGSKVDPFQAWMEAHLYQAEKMRYHEYAPICALPDFRLPGTPGTVINAIFPDISKKFAAGGVRIQMLCRLPDGVKPRGHEGECHVLCDDIPLKELVRAAGVGQLALEAQSGLSSVDITASLKAPARLPRLLAIAEGIGARIRFLVTLPRGEPIIFNRLELLEMRAPPTSGAGPVIWPGADVAAMLNDQPFTRTRRLSADMLGLLDSSAWDPETICGIDRAIRPFGAGLLLAILDHKSGWLLSNQPLSADVLSAMIQAGPDLAGREFSSLPDPEVLGLNAFNAGLYDRGITHRYVLRDIRSGLSEVFDDGLVATADQFRELARRREMADPA